MLDISSCDGWWRRSGGKRKRRTTRSNSDLFSKKGVEQGDHQQYSTPFHTGKEKRVTYNMKLRHVLTLLCVSLSLTSFSRYRLSFFVPLGLCLGKLQQKRRQ